MDKLVIKGGKQLNGTVKISGAKNASLPILAATILAEGTFTIHNVPYLRDIKTMIKLLAQLGIESQADSANPNTLKMENNGGIKFEAPYDLVKTMRASILVLGPLLAKRGKAKVSLPGGCAIGERPVDLHLSALEQMGAEITVNHGYIEAVTDRLKGAEITFRTITVTGTENIMMAACLAEGTTILRNAAQEPEVIDLANFLRSMGAKIKGDGTHTILIEGVQSLCHTEYSVMPDRIEAGTFLCAVATAGGDITITEAPVEEMSSLITALAESGLKITRINSKTLRAVSSREINPVDVVTMPYPGFPTDMQAQFMAVMTKAKGASVIDETIFENRFMHVAELKRMGADIVLKEGKAIVRGVDGLSGAPVMASDLRASAGLVIAALTADNTTEVLRVYHLDRGYERFDLKLKALGADIERVHVKDEL